MAGQLALARRMTRWLIRKTTVRTCVAFADFIRSTKAPARGPITTDVVAGEALFNQIGCATCHTPTLRTVPAGTRINGGSIHSACRARQQDLSSVQ